MGTEDEPWKKERDSMERRVLRPLSSLRHRLRHLVTLRLRCRPWFHQLGHRKCRQKNQQGRHSSFLE